MDTDGDGKIDAGEFSSYFADKLPRDREAIRVRIRVRVRVVSRGLVAVSLIECLGFQQFDLLMDQFMEVIHNPVLTRRPWVAMPTNPTTPLWRWPRPVPAKSAKPRPVGCAAPNSLQLR